MNQRSLYQLAWSGQLRICGMANFRRKGYEVADEITLVDVGRAGRRCRRAAGPDGGLEPGALRREYCLNPEGIDEAPSRLAWLG